MQPVFSELKMPQQKDDIWGHSNETILPDGRNRAKCRICKSSVADLVSRMKTHYDQCSIRHRECRQDRLEPSSTRSPAVKVSKQTELPFVSTKKEFKHELNLLITRYSWTFLSSLTSMEVFKLFNVLVSTSWPLELPSEQWKTSMETPLYHICCLTRPIQFIAAWRTFNWKEPQLTSWNADPHQYSIGDTAERRYYTVRCYRSMETIIGKIPWTI